MRALSIDYNQIKIQSQSSEFRDQNVYNLTNPPFSPIIHKMLVDFGSRSSRLFLWMQLVPIKNRWAGAVPVSRLGEMIVGTMDETTLHIVQTPQIWENTIRVCSEHILPYRNSTFTKTYPERPRRSVLLHGLQAMSLLMSPAC